MVRRGDEYKFASGRDLAGVPAFCGTTAGLPAQAGTIFWGFIQFWDFLRFADYNYVDCVIK